MQKLKGKIIPILFIIETILLIAVIVTGMITYKSDHTVSEIFRESSPDGQYTVKIDRIGDPAWLTGSYGYDRLTVHLFKPDTLYGTKFSTEICTDGGYVEYAVEWLPDGVQITLSGKEQSDSVYILPFPDIG